MNMRRNFGQSLVALTLILTGCGGTSQLSSQTDIPTPERTYADLKGRKCAVMVFADWRTRTEYNQIQIDTARLLTGKLEQRLKAAKDEKKSDSGVTTEFLNPASVVRYQREHPEVAGLPIVEVAPRLGGISRLVYVEFEDFAAQSPEAIMILKGEAKATLRIIEVENGKAKIAFEEAGIIAHFPPDAPEGVVPSDKFNVRTIYEGTLDRLTDILAVRFNEQ